MAEGWRTKQFYDLGQRLAPSLEKVQGYDIIAKDLGVTKQRALYITMVALGKLARGLQQRMQEDV